MKIRKLTLMAGLALALMTGTAQAGTLQNTQSAGKLKCGVSQGVPGFSNPDDQGEWTGLDVDFCRAVAAAVLGDPKKVEFTPLSSKARFTALQSGEIDLLSRTTTWTMSRDVALGLEFVGVNYYDGQGFMVRKDLGITSANDLSGAAVCTNTGSTTELNAADFFRERKMDYTVVAFEKADETLAAYDAGRCDVFTTDRSGLAAQRTKLTDPEAHLVLPEVISKEPLGPLVRQGDSQWADVARWVLNAMISAEELGVNSQNIEEMKSSTKPSVRRLLGLEGDFGEQLGLDKDWAYRVISLVGNYGEVYDANVGPNTPLKLERGVNAQWKDGGLIYAMPIR